MIKKLTFQMRLEVSEGNPHPFQNKDDVGMGMRKFP